MSKLIYSLPGRMALVLATTWLATGIIPLIFLVNLTILPVALKWALLVGVGMVAGLAVHSLLADHTLALRLLTAFLALSSSLCLLGWLTQDYMGFDPLHRTSSGTNWSGLGQLAIGSLSAWLALSAWRVTPSTKKTPRKPPARQTRAPSTAPPKSSPPGHPARPRIDAKPNRSLAAPKQPPPVVRKRPPATIPRRFWAAQRKFWATPRKFWVAPRDWMSDRLQALQVASQRLQTRLRSAGRTLPTRLRASSQTLRTRFHTRLTSRPAKPVIQLHTHPSKAQPARSSDSSIRMVGEMEHRCPYCLEVVEKNDPRGVKVCPICHTRHHADCWAVTGTCQVPHHYD